MRALDGVLKWCYSDAIPPHLDLAATVELLVAADFLEIPGLLARCAQLLGKLLTTENLAEAIRFSDSLASAELRRQLAVYAARLRVGSSSAPAEVLKEVPLVMQPLVAAEHRALLERQLRMQRERLAMAGAPRPAMVFWRQQLLVDEQQRILDEVLESADPAIVVPALLHGLHDKAPAIFRSTLDRKWAAVQGEARGPFEALAEADAAALDSARASIQEQLARTIDELAAWAGAVKTMAVYEASLPAA